MTPGRSNRTAAVTATFLSGVEDYMAATVRGQQAAQWSQRVADLKKTKPRDDQAIEEAQTKVKELAREARELEAKAKEIEDSVYDLKAVNPNKRVVVDTRTPEELMDIIEAKGKEVSEAIANLRSIRAN